MMLASVAVTWVVKTAIYATNCVLINITLSVFIFIIVYNFSQEFLGEFMRAMREIIRIFSDTRSTGFTLTDSRREGEPVKTISLKFNNDRSITAQQLDILHLHMEFFALELESIEMLFNIEVRKEKCQSYTLPVTLVSSLLVVIAFIVWLAAVFTPKAFHEAKIKSTNGSNELTPDQGGAVAGLGLGAIAIVILLITFIYNCNKARNRKEAEIRYNDNLGSRLQKLQAQMAIHSDLEIKDYKTATSNGVAAETNESTGIEVLGANTFTYSEFSEALTELKRKAVLHRADYKQEVLALGTIAQGQQYRQLGAGPEFKQQVGVGPAPTGKIIKMADLKLDSKRVQQCFDSLITGIKSKGIDIKVESIDASASATVTPSSG